VRACMHACICVYLCLSRVCMSMLNMRWLYRAAEGRSKLQEMQREITTLRRAAARKHSEQEKLRDQVFTAELQRDAALVKFHSEGQSLIRRIQELEAKQKISEGEGAGGTRVSKVLCIVTLYNKCTRALTFENFCQLGETQDRVCRSAP